MIRVPAQVHIPERYFWETAEIIVKAEDMSRAVAEKTDTREVVASGNPADVINRINEDYESLNIYYDPKSVFYIDKKIVIRANVYGKLNVIPKSNIDTPIVIRKGARFISHIVANNPQHYDTGGAFVVVAYPAQIGIMEVYRWGPYGNPPTYGIALSIDDIFGEWINEQPVIIQRLIAKQIETPDNYGIDGVWLSKKTIIFDLEIGDAGDDRLRFRTGSDGSAILGGRISTTNSVHAKHITYDAGVKYILIANLVAEYSPEWAVGVGPEWTLINVVARYNKQSGFTLGEKHGDNGYGFSTLIGCKAINNNQGGFGKDPNTGVYLGAGIRGVNSQRFNFIGCSAYDNQATKTQSAGISMTCWNGDIYDIIINGGYYGGNADTDIDIRAVWQGSVFWKSVIIDAIGDQVIKKIPYTTTLPTTGRFIGDMRLYYDSATGTYYLAVWTGSTWVKTALS